MELRVLRYFMTVAEERSITKAAKMLHITQPTLSRQLAELERELDTQLLLRSRGEKTVELTESGLFLKNRAEELLSLANKTAKEFVREKDTISGEIAIGCGETDAMRILADAARRIHMQWPDIRFHIFSGNAEDVTEKLDKGLIDFGLLVGAVDMSKYNSLALSRTDTWGVLMPDNHQLAAETGITPEMLLKEPLIMSQQSMAYNEFSGWIGIDSDKIRISATYNLIYNATFFVEAGLGLAVTIDRLVNTNGRPLTFRPLSPKMESRLSLVWKKHRVLSKAAELFYHEIHCQKEAFQ